MTSGRADARFMPVRPIRACAIAGPLARMTGIAYPLDTPAIAAN